MAKGKKWLFLRGAAGIGAYRHAACYFHWSGRVQLCLERVSRI